MVAKKPRIVIIGAGMAGLTAAHRLYTAAPSPAPFDLSVVEAGDRVGGRIRSSEFAGVCVEMGATWIHGIEGSPVYDIARLIGALDGDRDCSPWERMDGFPEDPLTVAEGGVTVDPSLCSSISSLYRNLMDFAKTPSATASSDASVGSFLRRGLKTYLAASCRRSVPLCAAEWSLEKLEEALFAMHENTERTYTSADDLTSLDLAAEGEYWEFPGEQITIAKGYSRVIEHLASVLPTGMIQMGKKVERIEWEAGSAAETDSKVNEGYPVRIHFDDGSAMKADHVIVTVSLGVLKAGTAAKEGKKGLFSPVLPPFKTEAIGRLGFGLVNKLFMEYEPSNGVTFPFLQMAFHQAPSAAENRIPRWIRRTTSICPVYGGSRVLLAWFVGKDAAELEGLKEEEIVRDVHATLEGFSPGGGAGGGAGGDSTPAGNCNGSSGCSDAYGRVSRVVRSSWGGDPLFLGSYSYVAVGSSGDDLDLMAEPLPRGSGTPLQILFAGEATHRTHYSTTHGAYFSGLREADRLLQHYKVIQKTC